MSKMEMINYRLSLVPLTYESSNGRPIVAARRSRKKDGSEENRFQLTSSAAQAKEYSPLHLQQYHDDSLEKK